MAILLTLVFGNEFAPAAPALLLMCAGNLVSAALGLNGMLLAMSGHERRVTRALFIGLTISLVLAAILVPAWRNIGAAAAFSCAMLVWNLLLWKDARRLLDIDTSLIPRSKNFGPMP